MKWRLITSTIFNLLICAHALADAIPPQPLVISGAQAQKLEQIFPTAVTTTDATPAPSTSAQSDQPPLHIVWKKIPLRVVLPVGEERILRFPGHVQFAYNKQRLTPAVFHMQNVNGTLYLVAKQAFAPQRVFVQMKATGELIIVDLSAQSGADDTPLAIVVPHRKATQTAAMNNAPAPQPKSTTVDYVELSRFAVQQLYAPKRLLKNPDGIYRVPMHTTRTVALVRDDSVMAMPLISWRAGNAYITAVLLRNMLDQSLVLDPRNLRGQWKTATFFPQTRLAPSGNQRDTTTVFLISDQPFVEALGA